MTTISPAKIIAVLVLGAGLLGAPAFALAQSGTYDFNKQSGLRTAAAEAGYDATGSAMSIEALISRAILSVISLVGVLFLVLLVSGAYTWMTARDNAEKVKSATNTILNAVVGLAVTLAAYAIAYFIIKNF